MVVIVLVLSACGVLRRQNWQSLLVLEPGVEPVPGVPAKETVVPAAAAAVAGPGLPTLTLLPGGPVTLLPVERLQLADHPRRLLLGQPGDQLRHLGGQVLAASADRVTRVGPGQVLEERLLLFGQGPRPGGEGGVGRGGHFGSFLCGLLRPPYTPFPETANPKPWFGGDFTISGLQNPW